MNFTSGMIQDLKSVSQLSCRNNWEYAGKLDVRPKGNKLIYKGITYQTSKKKGVVERAALDGPVTYHTHPCTLKGFHATLPSDSDFNAYIKGFPHLWMNIICDRDGFYVIQLTDMEAMPLPKAVEETMADLRLDPFLWVRRVSHEGAEYFRTDLDEWTEFVNDDFHPRMMDQFGISVSYQGYINVR
jgi:hypothetical protein